MWKKYIWVWLFLAGACTQKTSTVNIHTPKEAEQTDEPIVHKKYMVVEFYKEVGSLQAKKTLDSLECLYQPHSSDKEDDSHQNRIVASGIGHKYLLTFYNSKKQNLFLKKAKEKPAIYRIWDEQNHQSYTYTNNEALVVVFKLKENEAVCNNLLQQWNCTYYPGMDSSKGKQYFNATGPKFIVNFASKKQASDFLKKHKEIPNIYEIYKADWGILKD